MKDKRINIFKRSPYTMGLISANIIVFIITKIFYNSLTLDQVFFLYISGSRTFDFHSIFSILLSGFTHFGFLHILFNMMFLYYIGIVIERLIKPKYYMILYFGALFFSGIAVIYYSSPEQITIGASGALYGLLAFLICYYYLYQEVLKNYININSLLIILGLNLIITFTTPNISRVGHISGFIAGIFITVLIFRKKRT